MKTILVATDFSERSDRALRRATLLAKSSGAMLSLVHVVDDDQPQRIVEAEVEAARALMREQSATLRDVDGVACDNRVVLADPFAGIVRAADDIKPHLVVIGPHRRQALRDAFLGTTAERTIRNITHPVLMVNAPPVGPYRHALVTTDLSNVSRNAVTTYLSLGLSGDAKTSILHVYDVPAAHLAMGHTMTQQGYQAHLVDRRGAAARDLAAFVAAMDAGEVDQIVRLDSTNAATEILSSVSEGDIDLIVVGTRGLSGLARFVIGSTSQEVLRRAAADVLAIPSNHQD